MMAWRLTPWIARARLAWITRLRDRPLGPGEYVNWQVWAGSNREHAQLWRTFLAEQRALVRELGELVAGIPSVQAPALLLADPKDMVVPVQTARRLAKALPNGRLELIEGAGHHLPRRAPGAVADAIAAFLAAMDSTKTGKRRTSGSGDRDASPIHLVEHMSCEATRQHQHQQGRTRNGCMY
jgi:3-oxoadipate enol-lactonase